MKTKLSYSIALALAQTVLIDLAPACQRIEIAGSLRRKKAEIGDIEIVCIPELPKLNQMNWFGDISGGLDELLDSLVERRRWKRVKNGPLYKQFDIGPTTLDLFITTPEKWGMIFCLRSGPADFSHRLVTPRRAGGLCPAYLRVKDGRVWNNGTALPTPEEADVFRALGLDWIEPEKREK